MVRYLPIFACVLLLATPAAEAQIYTWTDANGVVHLADHRPGSQVAAKPAPRLTASAPGAPTRGPLTSTTAQAAPRPVAYRADGPAGTRFSNTFNPFIDRYAHAYSVSPDLVRAVIQVESGFNPFARSVEGAVGLMQLMPDTAVEMGVKDRLDPEDNIRGGVAYLRQLLNRYGDDVRLALAAYNAGPGAVDRHGTVPPYRETRQYVTDVTRRSGDTASRTGSPARAAQVVYKTVEIKDGRPVPLYSNTRPSKGPYEIVVYR